jgi:hypothetical protein
MAIQGGREITSAQQISDGIITNAKLVTPGKILQVINAVNTTQSTHSSATAADLLTAAITPSSTSSKIYVQAVIPFTNASDGDASFHVERDSTRLPSAGITSALINTGGATNNNAMMSMTATYIDSPSSTSELTYKLKVVTANATMYINRRGLNTGFTGATTLTLMEIAS